MKNCLFCSLGSCHSAGFYQIRGGSHITFAGLEGLIIRAKKIESISVELGLDWDWVKDLKLMASKYRTAGQRKAKDTLYKNYIDAMDKLTSYDFFF